LGTDLIYLWLWCCRHIQMV